MSDAEPKRLELSDAGSLRAMAHPARVTALTHLMRVGDATATELGELAGLSASAMSYHLRILERAGLVETAPSRGDGRERVWRSTHSGINMDNDVDASPEMQEASVEFLNALVMAQDVATRQFLTAASTDAELLNASHFVESMLVLTDDELADVGKQIQQVIAPYMNRRRRNPPPDARDYTMTYRIYPRVTGGEKTAERSDGG